MEFKESVAKGKKKKRPELLPFFSFQVGTTHYLALRTGTCSSAGAC